MKVEARGGEVLIHLTPKEAHEAIIDYADMTLSLPVEDGMGTTLAISKAATAATDGGRGMWNDSAEEVSE